VGKTCCCAIAGFFLGGGVGAFHCGFKFDISNEDFMKTCICFSFQYLKHNSLNIYQNENKVSTEVVQENKKTILCSVQFSEMLCGFQDTLFFVVS
jgi:hypothetical protein